MMRISYLVIMFLFFSMFAHSKVIRGDVKEINVRVSMADTKITFPEPVLLGVRESYKKDFQFEVIDDIVYVKARKPLDPQKRYRVIAKTKSKNNQKSYIIIVSYSDKSDDEITVLKQAKKTSSKFSQSQKQIEPHELFRHASQALYSPEYLIEQPSLLTALSIDKNLILDSIYRGSSLRIRPLAGFKYKDLYVYALSVKNKRVSTQELLHENLYGRIDAVGVGFQHRFVGLGSDDNSTLFIVSYQSSLIDVTGGIYELSE